MVKGGVMKLERVFTVGKVSGVLEYCKVKETRNWVRVQVFEQELG